MRVEAYRYENGFIGSSRHINSAFFTYDIPSDAHVPEYIPEAMVGIFSILDVFWLSTLKFVCWTTVTDCLIVFTNTKNFGIYLQPYTTKLSCYFYKNLRN